LTLPTCMRRPDMALSFQPVTLDGDAPDREGTLVFRNGRLLALLIRLEEFHGDLAGKWFVEATFGDVPGGQLPVLENTDAFDRWLVSSD
jgi:hypothetical protein